MKYQDENNLAQALQRGEEAAFDAVFRRWYAPLCHYACRLTESNMDEAEDLVQQAFVKLWESHARLDVAWSLKAYLYRSVHNACLNRIRSQKVQSKYVEYNTQQAAMLYTPPDDTSPELLERFQRALDALPPQCRHIFELSRFETLKYREIADQLGVSIKTVETQMGKALRVLRAQLADYLVTLFGIVCCWYFFSPLSDYALLHGNF